MCTVRVLDNPPAEHLWYQQKMEDIRRYVRQLLSIYQNFRILIDCTKMQDAPGSVGRKALDRQQALTEHFFRAALTGKPAPERGASGEKGTRRVPSLVMVFFFWKNCVIPFSIQVDILIADHLRTWIFFQYVLRIKSFSPTGSQCLMGSFSGKDPYTCKCC